MLKPPTPEQIDLYDVSEEEGDLFHAAEGVHVQCQLRGDELYVHNIEIDPGARRGGIGREIMTRIRSAYPGLRIVANGVEWPEPSGRFWKAMIEEGLVDRAVTYEHGEIAREDVDRYEGPAAPGL